MYKKWVRLTLSVLICCLITPAGTVYARKPPEITVITEIMFGSQEDYTPETLREEGKELYHLKNWKLEPVTVGSREKYVEQEVLYEEVEDKRMIPGVRKIASEEDFSGLKVNSTYPITRIKPVHEEWREDFSFPVVFHSYGAEEYQLGGKRVTSSGEPLKPEEYEEELLSEIGVNPDNYRVTKTVWAGAPYIDENGVLCRNAVASGKKKVTDYLAVYGGTVVFPEIEGFRCRAVYCLTEFEKSPAQEKIITSDKTAEMPDGNIDPSWIIKRETVVFTVSILLILSLLTAAAWIIKKTVEKKAERKDECG